MILNIFDDIWTKLNDLADNCYDFVMQHYENPFFWILIVGVIILICYSAISNLANK